MNVIDTVFFGFTLNVALVFFLSKVAWIRYDREQYTGKLALARLLGVNKKL